MFFLEKTHQKIGITNIAFTKKLQTNTHKKNETHYYFVVLVPFYVGCGA
jgi:hypothetical protein